MPVVQFFSEETARIEVNMDFSSQRLGSTHFHALAALPRRSRRLSCHDGRSQSRHYIVVDRERRLRPRRFRMDKVTNMIRSRGL